jgi:hypothetical protein
MAKNKKPEFDLDELDFLNMVLILGNTADIELGDKAPKGGRQQPLNLPRARQFINMLSVLEKKTHGRRTRQEDMVLSATLEDLQKKYVKKAGLDSINRSAVQAGLSHAQSVYDKNHRQ